MRRYEIEEQLSTKVKGKSWIVRQVWPLIKDFIIDTVFEIIQGLEKSLMEKLEKKKEELK